MAVYFGLIVFLLVFSVFAKMIGGKRVDNNILISFGVLLFIVYVFRDYSVGRDIASYCDSYENMGMYRLFDASWTWMEWGYVLLMKLCSMLGLSFRAFLAVVYTIVIIPVLIFIKRYSKDVTLSLIIFICFQFFVFSMSALRQTMAMSLCLLAYMVGQKNGQKPFFKYCLLVFAAVLIHRSAIVFAPAYFIMRMNLNFKMVFLYVLVVTLALLYNADIILGLRSNGEEMNNTAYNENLSIGAFFAFMLLLAVVSFIIVYKKSIRSPSAGIINSIFHDSGVITQTLANHVNLFICCILIQFVFRGYMLMRAGTYYQVFMLAFLPNLLYEFPKEIRPFLRFAIIIGMVFIFYYATLLPNELDIVPFRFVWTN